MKKVIVCCLVILQIIMLAGCQNIFQNAKKAEDGGKQLSVESGDRFVVYATGIPHSFMTDEGEFTLYPSKYYVGTHPVGGEINDASGNIFAQAVQEFGEINDIPIEIHFLDEFTEGKDPLQTILDENQTLPDMLIVGKHTRYDYNRIAKQGLLLNMSPYMQKEEDIANSKTYYQQILDGGKINNNQYILPFLFNLNGMITSEQFLMEIGMQLPEQNVTYEDIMKILEKSCQEMKDSMVTEAIYESSGMMPAGRYIPSILTAAAYPDYWNQDETAFILNEKHIASIFLLMQEFNQQEFVGIINWEEQDYLMNVNNLNKSSRMNQLGATAYENIGIFLSGGRSGGANFHNSLLTDAAYFHSVYENENKAMKLCGIPTLQEADTYSANITAMAMAFQTTKYPEIAYALARYLMDYEYPMFYGFSVNRDITQKQLEDIQNTTITVYPDRLWSAFTAGDIDKEEIDRQTEEIQPLDRESVAIIQNMLDHMAGAGLPCSVLEYDLYAAMLNLVGSGEKTPEEAAQWIMEKLEEYTRRQLELAPFYDAEYSNSLRLGSMQVH